MAFDYEGKVSIQLKNDIEHICVELKGLLLYKPKGIFSLERNIYNGNTCFNRINII